MNVTYERRYAVFSKAWSTLFYEVDTPQIEFFNVFYEQPFRAYHGKDHIKRLSLLNEIYSRQIPLGLRDNSIIEVAIWFHDLIYVVGRKDNELNSMIVFNNVGSRNFQAERVKKCIHHTIHDGRVPNDDPLSQYMCDLDIHDLADEYLYNVNSDLIRDEVLNAGISPRDFEVGRAKWLLGMAARSKFFYNPYKLPEFEGMDDRARRNMEFELARLLEISHVKEALNQQRE